MVGSGKGDEGTASGKLKIAEYSNVAMRFSMQLFSDCES